MIAGTGADSSCAGTVQSWEEPMVTRDADEFIHELDQPAPVAPPMRAGGVQESFGEQLRRYRERAALTQEELAERAGLTAMAISALERGERRRPYPNTVRALADALDLAERDRAEFVAAVPRRADAPAPVEGADRGADTTACLPSQPTPLLGRDEELAVVREPSMVLAAVARALRAPDAGGRGASDALREFVGHRRLLLVLDNFEQVLPAAA